MLFFSFIKCKQTIKPTEMHPNPNLVEKLALSFYCNRSDETIKNLNFLSIEDQERLIELTIRNPLIRDKPVNKRLIEKFLKNLIYSLEGRCEIHDDLYNLLCSSLSENKTAEYIYQHYIIENKINNIISLKESACLIQDGTTGLRTWEAAQYLADWLLCNKELVKNKNILELGSGVGLAGIALAKYCKPLSVCLSDCKEKTLNILKHNVRVNFPSIQEDAKDDTTLLTLINNDTTMTKFYIKLMDWNSQDYGVEVIPDVIIGSDIVFDPSLFKPLITTLKYFSGLNKNVEIILANTIRNDDTYEQFCRILEEHSYQITSLEFLHPRNFNWDETKRYTLIKVTEK